MKQKDYLFAALVPLAVLMIPLLGVLFGGWQWNFGSFVVAWVILMGAALIYKVIATNSAANLSYRLGAGLAVGVAFMLTWANLAVGIIGSEDNPINILYFGVVIVGLIGVGLSRFQPLGLARAAFVTAAYTLLIPVVAYLINRPDFTPGVMQVFVFNAVFAGLFAVSGLLFRHSAGQPRAASPTPR